MRNLLRRHRTVESITAPITKIVTQLNEHVTVHDDLAAHHKGKAFDHNELAADSIAESNKAAHRAHAISSLLG